MSVIAAPAPGRRGLARLRRTRHETEDGMLEAGGEGGGSSDRQSLAARVARTIGAGRAAGVAARCAARAGAGGDRREDRLPRAAGETRSAAALPRSAAGG